MHLIAHGTFATCIPASHYHVLSLDRQPVSRKMMTSLGYDRAFLMSEGALCANLLRRLLRKRKLE